MKKRKIFIPMIIVFILVSSYRFIKLNKPIADQNIYKEVKENEYFNINGVDFKVSRSEILHNEDDIGFLGIRVYIEMHKDGEIVQEGFFKSFPKYYFDEILLSVTDIDGRLVANNSWENEDYNKDNDKIKEIRNGERSIGKEHENLILTFRFDKPIIEGIEKSKYYAKLGFPRDENGMKFDYINLSLY